MKESIHKIIRAFSVKEIFTNKKVLWLRNLSLFYSFFLYYDVVLGAILNQKCHKTSFILKKKSVYGLAWLLIIC